MKLFFHVLLMTILTPFIIVTSFVTYGAVGILIALKRFWSFKK